MTSHPVVLILNSGSSSIKFNLFDGKTELITGQISGLGAEPHIKFDTHHGQGDIDQLLSPQEGETHATALQALLHLIDAEVGHISIDAVGHRVVHGGADYAAPIVLDDAVLADLRKLIPLAPLHQPHNLDGVTAAQQAFPNAVQVACFDTAFHRHHPWVNDTFALPPSFYEKGIKRYGFHGISYEYISAYLGQNYPGGQSEKVVVAHLGNGASMCAIHNGTSVGSTMGFTALDGLPMGTRCGQIDPGVVLHLLTAEAMSPDEVTELLYKRSGLKGMSGISQDMRALFASDAPEAAKAIDYFVTRIRRELGGLAAVMNGIDTLVFTAGIGENSPEIRRRVCMDQEWLGVEIDQRLNDAGEEMISSPSSRMKILVIPTDEEEMIRRHTLNLL
jgi:acetate kinase